MIESNVWITANTDTLKSHILSVGLRQSADWEFKVVSDADLVSAWLGSVSVKGAEIFDPDVAIISSKYMNLIDLIEPPTLLIVRLGVKKARNVAMGEVFWETIQHRLHIDKPIWVVDQPNDPLNSNHICWIEGIHNQLCDFERIFLDEKKKRKPNPDISIEPLKRTNLSDPEPVLESEGDSFLGEMLANENQTRPHKKKSSKWGKK